MADEDDPEEAGRRAAAKAVAAGHPRWCVFGGAPTDTMIDRATGLPLQSVRAVPGHDLEEKTKRFIAGHNAEIRRAKLAGEVHVDLRPFLTTREAVAGLFVGSATHMLAPKRPIDLMGGAIRYEVFVPRPPKTPPRFRPPSGPQVRRIDEGGRHFVLSYDGAPIPVAVGPMEETVAFETPRFWALYHVQTGAILQRFRR